MTHSPSVAVEHASLCPCCTLQPVHCGECGRNLGEMDYSVPSRSRRWCRHCKAFTFVVVIETRAQ